LSWADPALKTPGYFRGAPSALIRGRLTGFVLQAGSRFLGGFAASE